MTGITTHILDAALGQPAREVTVKLFSLTHQEAELISTCCTDQDGRVKDFSIESTPNWQIGDYRLIFEIKDYFLRSERSCFYPHVCIDFSVANTDEHYHVPLLISPYAYSTYRGS